MIFSTLTAISPVDGRYRNKAENLAAYFSEYALIKYRVQVEIEYFITRLNSYRSFTPWRLRKIKKLCGKSTANFRLRTLPVLKRSRV